MAVFIIYILLFLSVANLLGTRYSRGLNKFNGPFLASITDFWKVWYAYTGVQKQPYVDIHRKYGDVVRIGPNELSFSDPQAIRDIYGPHGAQQRGKEYSVLQPPINGVPMEVLFTTLDVQRHDKIRRLISPAFTMTNTMKYEPWVNENITQFNEQLRKRFVAKSGPGATMNVMEWASYFSMECIYSITFGEGIGFIEQGKDVLGIIAGHHEMGKHWLYFSRAKILYWLSQTNALLLWLNKRGWYNHAVSFTPIIQRQFFERQEYWKEIKGRPEDRSTLTDLFLLAQQEHPEAADFQPLLQSMSAIGGAVDPVGITISSIFYFLLKNRRCYAKLMEELDALGDPKIPVSFAVAQKLPHLNAVFQEAVRCHLLVRLPNTREVPAGGLAICGKWVPPGVCVGVYPSVLRHKREIFGEDVDMFRPERWLDDTEKVTRMSNAMFTFGYGKYSCIGKNIAKLEVLKLIPSVLREFEFSLVNPHKEWTLKNGPFATPTDLEVKVQSRK